MKTPTTLLSTCGLFICIHANVDQFQSSPLEQPFPADASGPNWGGLGLALDAGGSLSYEGHCIENLIQAAGSHHVPYFYRTQVGAEIDLVLEQGGKPEIAVEVKRSMAPSPERGFAVACDDLHIEQRYVVYPGLERIRLRHGAQAMGLQKLMELVAGD